MRSIFEVGRRALTGGLLAGVALSGVGGSTVHADGDLEFSGDVRLRGEYRGPFNYDDSDGGDPTSDDGIFSRVRLNFDYRFTGSTDLRIQVQDSRVLGDDSVSDSADEDLDLRQAYITFGSLQECECLDWLGDSSDVTLRIGRQELPTFGDGYIISRNSWENTGPTSFDGFWLDGAFGGENFGFDVDFLYADLSNNDPYGTGGAVGATEDTVFWGLQVGTDEVPWVRLESYYWMTDRPKSVDETIYGWRIESRVPEDHSLSGLDVAFEYAVAGGERGTLDVDANFWVLRGSYDFDAFGMPHTVGLGFSHASGSSGSASDDETWMAPLDYNHGILGKYDLVDNSNVDDLWFELAVAPCECVTLGFEYHMFTLDEEFTGWDTVSGGVLGAGGAITDDELGSEIDLYAKWRLRGESKLKLGVSFFQAGDAVEQATGGFDDNGTFAYVQWSTPFGGSSE